MDMSPHMHIHSLVAVWRHVARASVDAVAPRASAFRGQA